MYFLSRSLSSGTCPTVDHARVQDARTVHNSNNLLGWVNLVSRMAERDRVETFNQNSFDELKKALNPVILANRDTRDKVRETLAAYGIKLVYQEKFEKTP